MRPLTFVLVIALCFSASAADMPEVYKQIRVFVPDRATLDRIWSAGIDHEGSAGKIGGTMEFVAGEFELRELTRAGIRFEVIVDDLTKYYQQGLPRTPVNALGFGLGSMGGFYTLQEVLLQLDTMRLLYPHLITARDSIGRSQQGRAIWAVKIGSSQSAGKPEVLYTALHHAREPQGMMSVVYYMWWLLENYATNPEAAYLVNNRQQWFIPVVNPDGYEYNRSISPNGGGMWRKNRRDNGGGIYGVDLNRNYGPFYMWNAPNGGSSTSPGSDTYRGPSPFSEPELQAIDAFMRSHTIKSCLNYHTFGNYLIYPWGYLSRENGDSLIYRDWAYDMTSVNRFTNGTDQQTVAYSTRGNSDDYMFGDTTKPIAYTMTPEVGTNEEGGFWPPSNLILPLAMKTLHMNKRLAYVAGQFTTMISHAVQDAGGNGFLNRGENFVLRARLKNKGLTYGTVTISATTNLPTVVMSAAPASVGLSPQQELDVNLSGSVLSNATEGVPLQFYILITDAEGYQKIDTVSTFLGTPTVLFADSANTGTANWTTGSGWGLTSNAHTPPYAFTDSPSGTYAANANNSLTMVSQINLANFDHAELKFWTKWAIEPTWDFGTVEISTNNGSSWTTLRTELSHAGSARSGSAQPSGSWGFDSYTPGGTWVEQSVSLSPYVNRQIKIRFRMAADGGDQRDGFYVDDIRFYGYVTNVPPPDTGIVVQPSAFTLNGPTGRVFVDSVKIKNMTATPVSIMLAESLISSSIQPEGRTGVASPQLNQILRRLRPAFRLADRSDDARLTEQSRITHVTNTSNGMPHGPNTYTTILTDDRGETGLGGADIIRVQYQYRGTPIFSYHDFRIVMAPLPDTNVVIIVSVDTDQDFGTGLFPTPLGFGPTSRDIGSEREILIDASGIIIDSLTGFGRIPAGLVISTENDTLTFVGLPFPLSITRDSVLTISTESTFGGINDLWLADPDRKMNLGFVAARITPNSNILPDFAPAVGHGNVGGETGVSWLSEQPLSFTLGSSESTYVRITALAATPAGTRRANIAVQTAGRAPINIPFTMNVTAPASPLVHVSPTELRDTLTLGDSATHALTIANIGASTLTFLVLDTARSPWLSIIPPGGTLDSGIATFVSVTMRSAGLRSDSTYSARLFVVSNDPQNPTVIVPVSMRVRGTTGVSNENRLPTTFALHQNYPNPFNPETSIAFDLPQVSFVTLKVYDILGQEVATLIDGPQDAGYRSARFRADNLPSGVYFYRLHARSSTSAQGFVATRKLILLR